jgi:CubicO group peptidase (beta-lactamase class C family)
MSRDLGRISFLLGCLVLSGCEGQKSEAPLTGSAAVAEIDSTLRARAKDGLAASVFLVEGTDTLLSRGYGSADRAAPRPVTPETGFDIGSLVKPFTMAAILKLEGEGKLHLGDPLSTFFADAPADKAHITIRQLLLHSSGLPDIVDAHSQPISYTPDFDYEPVTRDEIVRRAMAAKLVFEPGSKSQYSNLGYSLLGVVIEKASGEGYEAYVHHEIFEPAGVQRTGYLLPGWQEDQLAVGYQGDRAWGTPLDHPWLADGPSWNLRGNGGMISTAGDLYRWIVALESGKILAPAQYEEFLAMSAKKNKRGTRTFGPSGGNDIFNSCYLWYLDENRKIVMLTSSDRFRAEDIVPEIAHTMRRIQP